MRSPLSRSRKRRRAFRRGDDDGITLIETVIALGMATAVLMALAAAAMTGMRASLLSQQNQQAGDVLTQTVEQLRDMPYGADGLQISTADATLAGDTAVKACGSKSGYCYDPGLGTGLEALQVSPTGQITQHQQSVTTNHYTFTVYMYITRPGPVTKPDDGYGADYERVTAVVRWQSYGQLRTRRTSTTITETLRGLPLPRFKFSNLGYQNVTVNPFGQVVYPFKLMNQGARDCWNVTTSDPSFSLYRDSNNNGVYDSGVDQALAACPLAGSAALEPATSIAFFAVRTLNGNPGPFTNTVTFTATSWAQPTAPTASHSLTNSYTVTNSVVTSTPGQPSGTATATVAPPTTTTPPPTGTPTPTTCDPFSSGSYVAIPPKNYTAVGYFLHNVYPNTKDTTAQAQLTMDRGAPTGTWLYDYATDLLSGSPGRAVQAGGAGATETNPAKVVDWRVQVGQMFVGSQAVVTLWAAPANGNASTHGTIAAYLNAVSPSGTVTPLTSGTFDASTWNCTGFRKFGILLGSFGQKLSTNTWIDLRVEVTGSSPMILGYDTTTFPAMLAIPEK